MKFEVGEVAVLAVDLRHMFNSVPAIPKGTEVTIKAIGYDGPFGKSDYELEPINGYQALVYERELRKRRPPEEPAEDEFQQDLKLWLSPSKKREDA